MYRSRYWKESEITAENTESEKHVVLQYTVMYESHHIISYLITSILTCRCQYQKDCTLNQDSRDSRAIRDGTVAPTKANNRVGKVGVHSHAWRQGDWKVGQQTHEKAANHAANCGGRNELTLDALHALGVLIGKGVAVGCDAGTARVL
jgi:hypothetical protein